MPRTRSDRRTARWHAALGGLLLAAASGAQALTVFTCEAEWAALVRELAPQAQVRSATHARQDPHHIEARPSLIAALRNADLAVCTGAGLEAAWLPTLQQRAGNPRVQDGAPGMVYASAQVKLIDPRPPGTPFEGDVHAEGNPHLHLDPRNLLPVAQAVTAQLQAADPARRADYSARLDAFTQAWRGRIGDWERRAASLRGARVATQHTTFAYFWRWLGVEPVADLEPKPGLPPTPGHLQRVLEATRANPPAAVVVSLYQDPRPAQWLGQQLGRPQSVLQLPSTVTEEAGTDSLAGLFDHLIDRLRATR
ncbi:zinc ABC transporter substrate-binding protein [Ramlibacter sp. AW1]|uniref:Zinc ABC transporter substrate-binding protein n=1 Tax=Ramlibacter aurantiacus TaxID=2801330 RepID=A0A936ZKC8_9BURK|nr:zinc ABC transporter substrate-binding protein [Ramlibacter aurantiacus]MBL0418878.1 zinc ABC transporter substrate-binding protein [Ramlibacter aurantiacus]